jgi:Fe-S-cluster-containing hydrogenase component 2/CRP-like cAMP-binding protein/thioredoxin reductase
MADKYKVAIVGSGPAGLSAASHAAKIGVSHILLEKTDHLSDTIYRYQKKKYVMAAPPQLVLRADVGFEAGYREKILDVWNTGVAESGANVRYNAEVKEVAGEKGDFTLTLTNGDKVQAEHIVLGIGLQGNPNLMRCPGGDLPHVQYQLDDPTEYIDEHIFIIGAGDAGIENALGLAADPAQANVVGIVNRSADFSRAKDGNVANLMNARDAGRMQIFTEASPVKVEPGWITLALPDGESRLRCDRIIARLGASAPRAFVEKMGVEFTSASRDAFPKLTQQLESTKPGIYVIGALAGYPLIKNCMNQGHDVIEFINGNVGLDPADEPYLASKLDHLPGPKRKVAEWAEFLRQNVEILHGLSALQMREYLVDSDVRFYRANEVIFQKNDIGSSLFGIASGSVKVEINPKDPSITVPIPTGSIFGEVGLISGRRRGATIRAAEDTICIEIPRKLALALRASVQEARETIERITTERGILQIFKSGLSPADIREVLAKAEVKEIKPGEAIIKEGDESYDIFIIRRGSMVVEREIGGKPVFLNYIPAGQVTGEMALVEGGKRSATVRAAIRSEVIKLDGNLFRVLLNRKPELVARLRADMAGRRKVNEFLAEKKNTISSVVDYYNSVARFLVEQGVGEATDVLLIDERLCVGCDNCEKACADSHDGISRLDREAGRTYANLHVPTSCRHCEHPHCMTDCGPNAIHRGPDGEVYIDDTCIACGNCERFCPYGVIRMEKPPPKKPGLFEWLLFGMGPGPGEPDKAWKDAHAGHGSSQKKATKCDMCSGKKGGPACVRACPTGAAIRVSPENILSVALLDRGRE